MIRVNIATNFPDVPIIRQLPPVADYRFVINGSEPDCDWFVAFDMPYGKSVTVSCPGNHRILITTEPPILRNYHRKYVEYFSTVYTCHDRLRFIPECHLSQQGLPWLIGVCGNGVSRKPISYADFKKLPPDKTKMLSVICSNVSNTHTHRQRQKFAQALKEHFKDKCDCFGRGIRPILDKWEAIVPYRYHIALENSSFKDYFTEKIADSYLGWAFPIYFGCPNIEEYFSAEQYAAINIFDIPGSIRAIEQTIAVDYERRIEYLRAARNLVLDKYNVFNIIISHIDNSRSHDQQEQNVVIPHNELCKSGLYLAAQSLWRMLPKNIQRLVK